MAKTPFGEFNRRERGARNLLLGDQAKGMKISTPYLSQMESGQRAIPDGIEDKVINFFGLSDLEANELRRAIALSRSEFAISLTKDASVEDRSLARDLAESFARLDPETKGKLRRLLEGKRHG